MSRHSEETAYRHLGNFSTLDHGGVPLICEHCRVSWTGCAAEAECPECGAPKGYFEHDLNKCYCAQCRRGDR